MKPELLALDIGATHTRLVAVSPCLAHLFHFEKLRTPLTDPLVSLTALIRSYLDKHAFHPTRIGISIAGQVTLDGTLSYAPNLNWSQLPLKATLENNFSIPVSLRNDAQSATLAEWRYGGHRHLKHMVALWIGTGIGGGIIANGTLLEGVHHAAGEIGHFMVGEHYLEEIAGGRGIAQEASRQLHHTLTTEEVFALERNGHPIAHALLKHARSALIQTCTSLLHLLNPEKIILGGALPERQKKHFEGIEEEVKKRALPQCSKDFTIGYSTLGEKAPLIGCLI